MFAVVLFGCSAIHLSGGPSTSDTVYGNGGSAVVKGDYLYFANAYISCSDLGHNDNTYDKNSAYTTYGIYRTKLNGAGKVILDSDGVPTKADLLTYNIGGYEYSGLYIFGNYLYYTTPYTNTTDKGEAKTGRMRVERVALDGTEHDIVYKFEDYTSDCSYNMVYIDGNVYIVYKNASKDIIVVSVDSRKNVKTSTVASSVESYAVFAQEDIDANNKVEDINKYVYYVIKDSNSDYIIYRTNFSTKAQETYYHGSSNEIVLKGVKNNQVYYTNGGYMYFGTEETKDNQHFQISTSGDVSTGYISSYMMLEDNEIADKGMIAVMQSDSKYYVNYYNNGTSKEIVLSEDKSKSITLVATKGSYFLYQIADDDALYRCQLNFEWKSGKYYVESYDISKIATSFSTKIYDTTTMLDYDGKRVFVYEQLDNSKYYLTMYMTDANDAYKNDSGELVGQYIGNK